MWSPSRSPEIWNVVGMLQAATELQRVDSRAVGGPRPGGNPPLGVRCPISPGRAHRGPRPGWAVTRRRLGADRARRHVLIGINSPTRDGPRREGPSATVPQPLSPSSLFSRHHARHMASHSQGEVASLTATPLSRDPCRFGFFTMSDQQLINVYS